jgi:mono/diheme cytochrome c family protein
MRRGLALLALAVVLGGCGGDDDDTAAPVEVITQTTAPPAQTGGATGDGGAEDDGRTLFVQNCSGCHTLADAGTTGKVGPNLDETTPSFERVRTMVTNGGGGGLGVMPAFKGSLSDEKIELVARYVSDVAGS